MPPLSANQITLALLLLCLMTVALVWRNPLALEEPSDSRQSTTANLATRAVVNPDRRLTTNSITASLADYAAIVERPLFDPTRRPPAPPSDDPMEAPPSRGEARRMTREQLELVGIVVVNDVRFALLKQAGQLGTTRVEVGEDVNGWEVESLTTAGAKLRRGSQTQQLTLKRKSNPKLAAMAAAQRRQSELTLRKALARSNSQAAMLKKADVGNEAEDENEDDEDGELDNEGEDE